MGNKPTFSRGRVKENPNQKSQAQQSSNDIFTRGHEKGDKTPPLPTLHIIERAAWGTHKYHRAVVTKQTNKKKHRVLGMQSVLFFSIRTAVLH